MKKDPGTPELHSRKHVQLVAAPSGTHQRVMDETMIDSMLLNEAITVSDHNVLERCQADIHRASLIGLRSPSMEPRSPNALHDISDTAANRRVRVNKAIMWMDRRGVPNDAPPTMGINHLGRRALYDLVAEDVPVPEERDAAFRMALADLHKFYAEEDR